MQGYAYVPVDDEDFKITYCVTFYDHPLDGLCKYKGETAWFVWDYYEEKVSIFKLTFREKLIAQADRKLFNFFVGRHYDYENFKEYTIRKPRWLHMFLFNVYYTAIAPILNVGMW